MSEFSHIDFFKSYLVIKKSDVGVFTQESPAEQTTLQTKVGSRITYR